MTNLKMVFVYHYVIILFDPQNSYKKDRKILTIEYHGGKIFEVINLFTRLYRSSLPLTEFRVKRGQLKIFAQIIEF